MRIVRMLFFLLLIPSLSMAQSTPMESARNFTRLMIISFVIILALWGLVWFRRKKKSD